MSTNPPITCATRLTAEAIAACQRDGAILLPGVGDAEGMKTADQRLNAFQTQQRSLPKGLADGGDTFLSQRRAYRQPPVFERLLHGSNLSALAGQRMRAWHEHCQDPLTFSEAKKQPSQALARSAHFPLNGQNDDDLVANPAAGRT
jgi:hypothetical protein